MGSSPCLKNKKLEDKIYNKRLIFNPIFFSTYINFIYSKFEYFKDPNKEKGYIDA